MRWRSIFATGLILISAAVWHMSAMAAPKTIVFFGDRLTAGFGLDPTQAYPALIQAKLRETGLDYEVVNAGISGDTTSGGVARLDWVLRRPVDVFVVALGANDGLRGISLAETRQNLA